MNNYGGEMKKYTVIGLEVLVSAIFIIAIVILALNINKNNKLQNSKKDNVVQNNQETINETHRELLEIQKKQKMLMRAARVYSMKTMRQ